MPIPILFFNYGNPKYLKYSLKQARYFNPHSEIYLLGDSTNNRYPFLTHINANRYEQESEAFTKIYKHRSSNGEHYELNCFLRWFYIRAFCRENNIGPFVYLDSDVLIFQDVSEMTSIFCNYSIANTCNFTGMPAFTYFSGLNAIDSFCDFLMFSYSDKQAIKEIEEIYKPFADNPNLIGAISDMILFHRYFLIHPNETTKLDIINNQLAVDIAINREDGYETEKGIKKVYWKNNLPFCKNKATGKLIRFATLHFQGDAKEGIIRHYKAGGYIAKRLSESYKIKFRLKSLSNKLKGYLKRIINYKYFV